VGGDAGVAVAEVGDLAPGVDPDALRGGVEGVPGGEGGARGGVPAAVGEEAEVGEEAPLVARRGLGGEEGEELRLALAVAAGHADEFLPAGAVAEGEEAGFEEGVVGGGGFFQGSGPLVAGLAGVGFVGAEAGAAEGEEGLRFS
jgi:hypothetical protein